MDTSVWSEALRRAKRKTESIVVQEFRNLILEHRVDIIGPIRQEILSGLREDAQFQRLEEHLSAFPDLSLTTDDYIMAAKFFNTCRAKEFRARIQTSSSVLLPCEDNWQSTRPTRTLPSLQDACPSCCTRQGNSNKRIEKRSFKRYA